MQPMKHNFQETGVSLVEVLVTLVLISLAMLGSASLQVLSKQSNFSAAQRTGASHLANDYLARMRGNRLALADYLPANDLGAGSLGDAPEKNCATDGVNCSNDEIAAFDQWQWEQELDGAMERAAGVNTGGLLEPTACITGPVGGVAGVYQIDIAWRGATEHPNPTTSACGEASGKYGEDNEYRHVIVMRAFINDE